MQSLRLLLNGNNYMTGDGNTTGNGLHFAPLADTSVDNSIVRGLDHQSMALIMGFYSILPHDLTLTALSYCR